MSIHSDSDKRIFRRLSPPAIWPVQVDINGEDFIEVAQATDISEGGLGLCVPHHFEGCGLDDLVQLIIELPVPEKSYFTVMGRIVHLADDFFGVVFIGLNERARLQIQLYMEHCSRQRATQAQ